MNRLGGVENEMVAAFPPLAHSKRDRIEAPVIDNEHFDHFAQLSIRFKLTPQRALFGWFADVRRMVCQLSDVSLSRFRAEAPRCPLVHAQFVFGFRHMCG